MTSSELGEWMAYSSIEPFGEYRSELRHGQHMAMVANINRDSEKKPDPYRPIDFMNFIEYEEPDREYTDEELEAYAAQIFGV